MLSSLSTIFPPCIIDGQSTALEDHRKTIPGLGVTKCHQHFTHRPSENGGSMWIGTQNGKNG